MKQRISKNFLLKGNYVFKEKFPKYTSQIINLANQNGQGTRPFVVGQMSELFPQYRNSSDAPSLAGWTEWYLNLYPDAIDTATDRIMQQIDNLKNAIQLIDRPMVKRWVTDLVLNKTYIGLYYQQIILAYFAEQRHETWRLSTSEEEAQGIDGYIGDKPYSIKPETYKTMNRLPEIIGATIIYYKETGTDLIVEIAD